MEKSMDETSTSPSEILAVPGCTRSNWRRCDFRLAILAPLGSGPAMTCRAETMTIVEYANLLVHFPMPPHDGNAIDRDPRV
jgi:hypothetical protein